jgi:hypothetical protein
MAIKRPRYFDHQFLIEADFTAEQQYHLGMRRRLNRLLYSPGIVEGLAVQKTAAKVVTVQPGVAIDRSGQEIIVEENRVIDLSNAALFPANATVFITAAYQELETEPSTATGAPGNTRFTELPLVQAVTTPPPTDGSVIRLASFRLDAAANVPGNVADLLDGGVRLPVLSRTERGLASLDGVSNAQGNIDLAPAQSIVIVPDDANNRITIGESHSARTDNPHATTAAQIQALPAADYDLRRRALASITFSQVNVDGATSTLTVGFQPKVVIVAGTCTASLSGRAYSGGVGGFAFLDPPTGAGIIQRCFGFGITRLSNSDWLFRSLSGSNIFTGNIQDQGSTTPMGEILNVALTTFTANGLVATFTRGPAGPLAPLTNFTIALQLMCLG